MLRPSSTHNPPAFTDTGSPGLNKDTDNDNPPLLDAHQGPSSPVAVPQGPSSPPADPAPLTTAPLQMDPRSEQSATSNGRSSAWKELRDTMRSIDEGKVKDAKEDLDNLLVFAGLFSAVVTTFVVDSYASLQPDNTDRLVFLMQQSLAQNYTYVDGILRPVSPFPSLPSFKAPLWALRVNGLWFASLVVSLSTASFGLLVKQWLTEYLAMDWITPEDQLRARQFRYPGLISWKVYEIAAALPLLLHISLGLFFLGLCFYTAAADEMIGQSTFPLVVGWAFLALFAIFAPFMSSHCPYKITLLKTMLQFSRRLIGLRIRWLLEKAISYVMLWPSWTARHIFHIYVLSSNNLWHAAHKMRNRSKPFYFILHMLDVIYGILHRLPNTLQSIMNASNDDSEKEAVGKSKDDANLLVSIDKVLASDGPILQSMAELLQQNNHSPEALVNFIIGCIHNRTHTSLGAITSESRIVRDNFPFASVSFRARIILIEQLSRALSAYLAQVSHSTQDSRFKKPEPWMINASVMIITSSSFFDRSEFSLSHKLYSNPSNVSSLLQMAHGVISEWDRSDTRLLIEEAFVPPGAWSWTHSIWEHLPQLSDSTLSDVQESTIQLLLMLSWCKPKDEGSAISVPEAIIMLLHVLNCSGPVLNQSEDETYVYYLYSGGNGSSSNVKKELSRLCSDYKNIASPLAATVHNSSHLIVQALKLYQVYISQSLQDLRPMWKVLCTLEDDLLQHALLHPAMPDLWAFVVECAHRNTLDTLHTEHFVKLCLVLAHIGVPYVFNLDRGSSDWNLLIPVLRYAADELALIKEDPADDPDETIPKLAGCALESPQRDTLLHPERAHADLDDVLRRLAGMEHLLPPPRAASAGLPRAEAERRTGLWCIVPPVISSWFRRPRESAAGSRRTDVEEGLPVAANDAQPEPVGIDLEHTIRAAVPPSTDGAPDAERSSEPSSSTVERPRLPPSAGPSSIPDSYIPPDADVAGDTAVQSDGPAASHAQPSPHDSATSPTNLPALNVVHGAAHRVTGDAECSVQPSVSRSSSESRVVERDPSLDPGASSPGAPRSSEEETQFPYPSTQSQQSSHPWVEEEDKLRSLSLSQDEAAIPLADSHATSDTSVARVSDVPRMLDAADQPSAPEEATRSVRAHSTPPDSARPTEPHLADRDRPRAPHSVVPGGISGTPDRVPASDLRAEQVGSRIEETRYSAHREDEPVVSAADPVASEESSRIESGGPDMRSPFPIAAGGAGISERPSRDNAETSSPPLDPTDTVAGDK